MLYDIFVQAIGIVAMIIIAFSFQQKSQKKILFIQMFGNLIFIVHFLLLNAISGALGNAVAMLRAIIFWLGNKYKWASHKAWIYVFAFAFLFSYVLAFTVFEKPFTLYNALVEILPAVGSFIITFGFGVQNARTVRIIYLIGSPFWLAYSILTFSISGALNEALNIASIILAIVRLKTHIKAVQIDPHHHEFDLEKAEETQQNSAENLENN